MEGKHGESYSVRIGDYRGVYWRYSLRGHSPKGGKINGTSDIEIEAPCELL